MNILFEVIGIGMHSGKLRFREVSDTDTSDMQLFCDCIEIEMHSGKLSGTIFDYNLSAYLKVSEQTYMLVLEIEIALTSLSLLSFFSNLDEIHHQLIW